jgi:hypothetical protein
MKNLWKRQDDSMYRRWTNKTGTKMTITYSLFFNQRTTTPQFTLKIELTTLYTFDLG